MISLGLVRATNTKLVNDHALVAVFVGAASGIGEFSVRALAAAHGTHGKGLRLYLVARNEAAAKKILVECLEVCPSGQFIFVKANDLSLLKNVDEVSAKIISLEEQEAKAKGETARIDFLVMCQGIVNFGYGRQGQSLLSTIAELSLVGADSCSQRPPKDLISRLHCSTTPACDSFCSFFRSCSHHRSRPVSFLSSDLGLRRKAVKTRSGLMTCPCGTPAIMDLSTWAIK